MKKIYIILTIFGTILPLSQFYQFLELHGLDIGLFFSQLFVNKISSFFAMDVFVSAIVTIIFINFESKKLKIQKSWICYIALFFAGVSSALPLFLYLREKKSEDFNNEK